MQFKILGRSNLILCSHERWQRGGCGTPWIFKHGTNIVDRGLIVLFFGLFLLLLFFGVFSIAIFCYDLTTLQ